MIPYGRHWIGEDDIEAIVAVLRSDDNIADGPKSIEFEKALANYIGVKYAVVVSSGTAALHAACYAAGISSGDEVITSPNTFVATAAAAMFCGGVPVFADIDAKTHNILPRSILDRIGPKTKAIMPVDYAGQPCDYDAIMSIAKEHNLVVIEDAAEAIGSEYKGSRIGTISDMTIFSFHAVKNITTCEGGVIVTNNEEYYYKLKRFRAYGIDKQKPYDDAPWMCEQAELGYNYRLSEIQCALGISQLKKLDQFIARRTEIADKYYKGLCGLGNVTLPYIHKYNKMNWYMYVIQVEGIERKKVWEELKNRGIMTGIYFYPVYKLSYFQDHGYKDVCCRESEKFYEAALTLPCFPKLTDAEVDEVINAVIEVCR